MAACAGDDWCGVISAGFLQDNRSLVVKTVLEYTKAEGFDAYAATTAGPVVDMSVACVANTMFSQIDAKLKQNYRKQYDISYLTIILGN
jgi:hypothetical protein